MAGDRLAGDRVAGGGLAGAGRPVLIVLRGNSASGKSAVAAEIRRRRGARDLAIVGQDHLRRVVLRERDEPGGANIALIELTARFALEHGYHTIVEGILYAAHYADMLSVLVSGHAGRTRCYYLDVPFDETVRRHATKSQAAQYGPAEMRSWYRERDFLPGLAEDVIPAGSTLDETVTRIMTDTGLSVPSGGADSARMAAAPPPT
ncbi:MAG: AAA family ATPase [Trebonia sp.]